MNERKIVRCSNCGQKVGYRSQRNRETAPCPKCGTTLQLIELNENKPSQNIKTLAEPYSRVETKSTYREPSATNFSSLVSSSHSMISKHWLTAGELLEFLKLNSVKNIEITLPFKQIEVTGYEQNIKYLSTLDCSAPVYDASGRYVAFKVIHQAGCMQLHFWERFFYYLDRCRMELRELGMTELGKRILVRLRDLSASYELGMRKAELRDILRGLLPCTLELNRTTGAYVLICDPILLLRETLDIWERDPGYSDTTYSGGGFGLQGAAAGMLIANWLNSTIERQNRELASYKMNFVESRLTRACMMTSAIHLELAGATPPIR